MCRIEHGSTRCATLCRRFCRSLASRSTKRAGSRRLAAATTLDEVARLAGRLQNELKRWDVHQQVIRYCEEEILRKSIFHAVFEATKGVAERLRDLSGSTLDGADLVDHCFSTRVSPPVIRINDFRTETQVSEHKGFATMLKGVFGTFRNPPAHAARAAGGWTIAEPDAPGSVLPAVLPASQARRGGRVTDRSRSLIRRSRQNPGTSSDEWNHPAVAGEPITLRSNAPDRAGC
jgi:uncharacterized protein (TIGR02391 family)